MANFETIQNDLNNDKSAQEAFISDPIGYLSDKGVEVSQEMGDHLQKGVEQYSSRPTGQDSGTAAADSRDRSLIRIVIEF
jgi:hypothetical protein